jgi:methyl-accepting chemotaxis protein
MKLTLGKKLGLGFGVILALMVFSSSMAYLKSADMSQSQDRALDLRVPTLEAAKDLQRDLNQTQSKGRQAVLAGAQTDRREAAKKLFDGAWIAIEKDIAAMGELAPKWTVQANRDHLDEIRKQLPLLRAAQETAMNHATGGDRDAVTKAGNEFADQATPAAEAIKTSLGTMMDSFVTLVDQNKEELKADSHSLNLTMAVTTFVALGIGIFVATFLSRRITGSTQSILARAEAIAAGDLTREELIAQGDDELADLTRAINQMQTSLHALIQSMRETAEQWPARAKNSPPPASRSQPTQKRRRRRRRSFPKPAARSTPTCRPWPREPRR